MKHTYKNGKQLRYGYTTGSCATAAVKAGIEMLLSQEEKTSVRLITPNQWTLNLEIHDKELSKTEVICAIKKDSGDDPDITNGMMVYARVAFAETTCIKGGEGVGVVTRKGLSVAIGQAAINPVPMQMIHQAIEEVSALHAYKKGFDITISMPEGVELAKKTFNPRLGIEGGLSIIGTTGIVEPMSEESFKESLYLDLKQNKASTMVFAPGNYGRDHCLKKGVEDQRIIKISNFVGYMFERACEEKVENILFVGHIGKLIKVAGGIFHTHNRVSDGRMPILSSFLINEAVTLEQLRCVMASNTTEEAVDYIVEQGLESVFKAIVNEIKRRLELFCFDNVNVEVILFSLNQGLLAETDQAEKLMEVMYA